MSLLDVFFVFIVPFTVGCWAGLAFGFPLTLKKESEEKTGKRDPTSPRDRRSRIKSIRENFEKIKQCEMDETEKMAKSLRGEYLPEYRPVVSESGEYAIEARFYEGSKWTRLNWIFDTLEKAERQIESHKANDLKEMARKNQKWTPVE